jgi:hypothetical protein
MARLCRVIRGRAARCRSVRQNDGRIVPAADLGVRDGAEAEGFEPRVALVRRAGRRHERALTCMFSLPVVTACARHVPEVSAAI